MIPFPHPSARRSLGVAPILHPPAGTVIVATDGSFGAERSGIGVVILAWGRVIAEARPAPDATNPKVTESMAARRACEIAVAMGADHLRLLVDCMPVAMSVLDPSSHSIMHPGSLEHTLERTRRAGVEVSVRLVQGHAETSDLPSRLNDLAHRLSNLCEDFRMDIPMDDNWHTSLVAAEPRLIPEYNDRRWKASISADKAARFLGVDMEVVDDLVALGHLYATPLGLTRLSVSSAYVAMQELRTQGFFGIGEPGAPTSAEDLISCHCPPSHEEWLRTSLTKAPERPSATPAECRRPAETLA